MARASYTCWPWPDSSCVRVGGYRPGQRLPRPAPLAATLAPQRQLLLHVQPVDAFMVYCQPSLLFSGKSAQK